MPCQRPFPVWSFFFPLIFHSPEILLFMPISPTKPGSWDVKQQQQAWASFDRTKRGVEQERRTSKRRSGRVSPTRSTQKRKKESSYPHPLHPLNGPTLLLPTCTQTQAQARYALAQLTKTKCKTTYTQTAKQLSWTGLDLDWIDSSIITPLHAFVANRKYTIAPAHPLTFTHTQTQTQPSLPLPLLSSSSRPLSITRSILFLSFRSMLFVNKHRTLNLLQWADLFFIAFFTGAIRILHSTRTLSSHQF